MFFDFGNLYDRAIEEAPFHSTLVELGVAHGISLAYLGTKARESNKHLRVIGIDNFRYTSEVEARKHVASCHVDLFCGDSADMSEHFNDVWFVFIDADHSYEGVKRDIVAWHPKITPGGVIAGHDAIRVPVHNAIKDVFGRFARVQPSSWWVYV